MERPPGSTEPQPEPSPQPVPMPWERPATASAPATLPSGIDEPVDPEKDGGPAPEVFWAPPPSPKRREVEGAPGLVYAGVIPRTIAWLVDGLLVGFLSLVVIGILITIIVGSPEPGDTALSFVAWVGIAVITAAYLLAAWLGQGRATVGMRLLSLRIGAVANGAPLTLRQAIVRVALLGIVLWPLVAIPTIGVVGAAAFLVWPFVLLISAIVHPKRQGIHDRVAGTAIVGPAEASSGRVAILAAALLIVIVVFVMLAYIGSQLPDEAVRHIRIA
jgi:uncharacterized RDD family membrane protein YckC